MRKTYHRAMEARISAVYVCRRSCPSPLPASALALDELIGPGYSILHILHIIKAWVLVNPMGALGTCNEPDEVFNHGHHLKAIWCSLGYRLRHRLGDGEPCGGMGRRHMGLVSRRAEGVNYNLNIL